MIRARARFGLERRELLPKWRELLQFGMIRRVACGPQLSVLIFGS